MIASSLTLGFLPGHCLQPRRHGDSRRSWSSWCLGPRRQAEVIVNGANTSARYTSNLQGCIHGSVCIYSPASAALSTMLQRFLCDICCEQSHPEPIMATAWKSEVAFAALERNRVKSYTCWVDVAAPASTSYPRSGWWNAALLVVTTTTTASMACPHVTGVLAVCIG